MLIPAASHNGASAVLRAWLIRDLKRRGRMRVAVLSFRVWSFVGLAFELSREAFGSSQRGEVHHGTL